MVNAAQLPLMRRPAFVAARANLDFSRFNAYVVTSIFGPIGWFVSPRFRQARPFQTTSNVEKPRDRGTLMRAQSLNMRI
jgi:hypothetical protein